MENKTNLKLIHVGIIKPRFAGTQYLLLRKKDPHTYTWFNFSEDGNESETEFSAPSVEEALRIARKQWKDDYFRPLNCGYRYTLPERDEHGMNALFHQMTTSYSTMTGVYFDDELGNNCIVNFASQEARDFWQKLKVMNKL